MASESELDSGLIDDLRERFQAGCTISELVRIVRERLPNSIRRISADYLMSAFCIGPGGLGLIGATDSFGSGECRDSKLSMIFVPRVVESKETWSDESAPAWFDGLTKHGHDAIQESSIANRCGLSPEGWAGLSERDRMAIIAVEVSHRSHCEDLVLLSELAERLQARINELEVERLEAPAV